MLGCIQGDQGALKEYSLGGVGVLLPDAVALARQVFVTQASLANQIWKAMFAVWCGSGGPFLSTLVHVMGGDASRNPVFTDPCPEKCRLPDLEKASDKKLERVYKYLRRIQK